MYTRLTGWLYIQLAIVLEKQSNLRNINFKPLTYS